MNEQTNLKSHPQVGLLGLYYDPYINTIWLGSRVHWYARRHSKVLTLTFRASKFVSIKKYIFELYLCYTSNAMKYLRRYLPGTKKYPTVHFVDFTIFVKINIYSKKKNSQRPPLNKQNQKLLIVSHLSELPDVPAVCIVSEPHNVKLIFMDLIHSQAVVDF